MKLKSVYIILLMLFCSGCSVLNTLSETEADRQMDSEQKTEVFQDLLKQGWEMKVHNGRMVLIKNTESGILINDVFGVLESD